MKPMIELKNIKKIKSYNFQLQVNCYNPHLGKMEPFVEKTNLILSQVFTDKGNPKKYMNISLENSNEFNIETKNNNQKIKNFIEANS